jgi:RNase P subunit RPR2
MLRINVIEPSVELYISTCSDFVNPRVSAQRIPNKRVSVPRPSPRLWEHILGKSPLRLVVKRRWNGTDSFVDCLECGHESQIQFVEFAWDEHGHIQKVLPTAKRRRCQECRRLLASPRKPMQSELPSPKRRIA